MGDLIFHKEKIADMDAFLRLCPFGALSEQDGEVRVSAACKMCKLCVKNGDGGATFEEEETPTVDKNAWRGIAVYVDHDEGVVHPVTRELIGKARVLADKVGQPVYCLFMGHNIGAAAEELLHFGVDKVMVYDAAPLKDYITQSYAAVFEDFINRRKPSVILVGATPVGRQLAPRVAARFRTGLTADCTVLDIKENTDLVQIRPAFGGNIMAEIHTPHTRPQMATVRYKVMDAPQRTEEAHGEIVRCEIAAEKLAAGVTVCSVTPKPQQKTIEQADVLVVAGRGVKSKEDVAMVARLAELLGGELAGTRPMIESGMIEARRQIGLSGRTVRPKLIITCGVYGAVQFTAGMNNADCIIAINKDEKAPIFKVAHYGMVGDLYEIVPALIAGLERVK